MVISDFNIICVNQQNAEYFDCEVIKCDAVNINLKTPNTYANWNILQGFKGIWYDIYPIARNKDNYQYDDEFFDLSYKKDVYDDKIIALQKKKNQLICIEKFRESIISIIDFYLKKSPIKRICFMVRVQDEEVEAILGTLSRKEFISKLKTKELRYNVAYIISSD